MRESAFVTVSYTHLDVYKRQAMLRALRASAVFHPSVEFLSSVGTVLVVFFGGVLAYRGQLSVEDILSLIHI